MPAVLLASLSGALAGGAGQPGAWLGERLNPLHTAFCQHHRCRLSGVRHNSEQSMGWHDGTRRTYTLRGGVRMELDVRPAGWISNARLLFAPARGLDGWPALALSPNGHRLAAEFLTNVTGQTFRPSAIAACERAGRALRDPDAVSPAPLSLWQTPGGLPFKARCGVRGDLGVWAGWRQQ